MGVSRLQFILCAQGESLPRDREPARALGKSSETAHDSLEERVARLSISIGSRAAAVRSTEDREVIFAVARDEIVEELVERGHPLHEAAVISDDVIAGARKIVSVLIAHGGHHG